MSWLNSGVYVEFFTGVRAVCKEESQGFIFGLLMGYLKIRARSCFIPLPTKEYFWRMKLFKQTLDLRFANILQTPKSILTRIPIF